MLANPDESGSAAADHGTEANHAPVPNATASPPIRPIYLADFIAPPLSDHPRGADRVTEYRQLNDSVGYAATARS
jgi:hypothetical protein